MSNHKEYLFKFLMALSVLGLLVGSWGVFQIMAYGKNATALGSYVTWGLWVAVYLFFRLYPKLSKVETPQNQMNTGFEHDSHRPEG